MTKFLVANLGTGEISQVEVKNRRAVRRAIRDMSPGDLADCRVEACKSEAQLRRYNNMAKNPYEAWVHVRGCGEVLFRRRNRELWFSRWNVLWGLLAGVAFVLAVHGLLIGTGKW